MPSWHGARLWAFFLAQLTYSDSCVALRNAEVKVMFIKMYRYNPNKLFIVIIGNGEIKVNVSALKILFMPPLKNCTRQIE